MEARCVATESPRFTEGAGVARRPRSRLVRYVALALATLALATLALAARADAYVYWTDGAKDTIGRSNLDGTGVDRSFIRGLVHPAAMAVDTTHGYLYWVSANPCCTSDPGGTIGRANLDGTGVDPDFISTRTYAGNAMAVDDAHIYWVSKVSDPSPTNPFGQPNTGTIGRANLDGTGVDPDFISGIGYPRGVAVDGAHVYWDDTHPTVTPTGACPTSRSGAPTSTARASIRASSNPAAGTGWRSTTPTFTGAAPRSIHRASLDGTGVELGFIDLQRSNTVFELAVNGSHIYWIGVVGPSRIAIGRANLDGSRVTNKLITGFNPFGGSDPTGLALDALGPPPSNEFGFRGVKVSKKGVGEAHGQGGGSGRAQARKDREREGPAQARRAVRQGEADRKGEGQGKEEAGQERQGDREGKGDLYPRRRRLRHQEQERQAGEAVARRPTPRRVCKRGEGPARQDDRLRTPEIPTVRVGAGFRPVGATGFEPATFRPPAEGQWV